MTVLRGFSVFRSWGLALSLLALCSALLAPASALARDISTGKWSALCGSATGPEQDGQAQDDAHCDLCQLPGPVLPAGARQLPLLPAPLALPQSAGRGSAPAGPSDGPFIRGPPSMFLRA